MKVLVYVEGGHPKGETAELKRAFRKFFESALPQIAQPRFIPCGPRDDAFRSFRIGLQYQPDNLQVLLVDAWLTFMERAMAR